MNKFAVFIFLAGIVFVGCTSNTSRPNLNPNSYTDDVTIDNVDKELSEDGVVVELENTGENSWKYKISTNLPTPCYEFKTDILVAESFPEQVTFNAVIEDASNGDACIQVIQPAEQAGVLQVNENATFRLEVVRK